MVAATVVADDEVDNPVFTTDATAPQPEPEAQPTLDEFLTDLNLEQYTDALGELGVAKMGHIADLDKVRTDKRIGPASLTFICAAGRFGERRNEGCGDQAVHPESQRSVGVRGGRSEAAGDRRQGEEVGPACS